MDVRVCGMKDVSFAHLAADAGGEEGAAFPVNWDVLVFSFSILHPTLHQKKKETENNAGREW